MLMNTKLLWLCTLCEDLLTHGDCLQTFACVHLPRSFVLRHSAAGPLRASPLLQGGRRVQLKRQGHLVPSCPLAACDWRQWLQVPLRCWQQLPPGCWKQQAAQRRLSL
jgi:hypothetical protein